ncbi:MAG TPA: hypothetical protein V6C81_24175 [Planktothrix sp.]|jgi:hypothetical protein
MISKPIIAALSLSIMLGGMQSARAQLVEETISSPGAITTMPVGETTVTKTTTTTTSDDAIPVAVPEVSRKTIYMEGPIGSTTSSATVLLGNGLGREDYAGRLAKMQEQINMGMERGFISSTEGANLSAQQNDLCNLEANVCANGFQRSESNDLEKRMNALNIRISNELTAGSQTAGVGSFQ